MIQRCFFLACRWKERLLPEIGASYFESFHKKKTYELKHIAEQKMRIARMHGPLISLIFFILCIQPLICHALLGISLMLFAIYIIVNKYYYLMGLSSDA
ncbi:Uncharacterised protein [Anaerobiospirillum thomasii]|uniref:Uncharacterized protein n=1 Tax=Anaerobiospirillum thomasii TaxID=179995 RepID=A0A2X0VKK8_9GAMM|nr:Uncharacterised protein [Anaerobiospirillum thomasii]